MQGAAGEDQVVGEGEGGHEGLADVGAVEFDVGGVGGEGFLAVGEAGGFGCGWGVEFVDVGGDVICEVDSWKADKQGGVLVLVVGVLVHVEEVGVGPVVAGMCQEDCFVLFWIGFCVGDVVDMMGIRASKEGVNGRERELENRLF